MQQISIEELAPIIKEIVQSGAEFRLYPMGKSMLPTIVEGEDSVLLVKPDDLSVLDAVLYVRENGKYVLHRIVASHDDTFDMCGDAQIDIERNVPYSNILAKVSGIYKKDVLVRVDTREYKNYIKKLYSKKPYKRFIKKIKRKVYSLYHVIFK